MDDISSLARRGNFREAICKTLAFYEKTTIGEIPEGSQSGGDKYIVAIVLAVKKPEINLPNNKRSGNYDRMVLLRY